MNTAAIASAARRTQSARQSYWATVADPTAPAWLLKAREEGLRISEKSLATLAGSPAKARAAEVAYIESIQSR